jgi:uncharacterized protein
MPLITDSDYAGAPWWQIGQLQTLAPALLKPPLPPFERTRLELADGDFLDLDWLKKGNKRLVVLTHGLEGSSGSTYIRRAAWYFWERNYDVLAWNCRSCSGEINRLLRFYNHGDIADIEAVLNAAAPNYESINLVGYSMGGNISLKFAALGLQTEFNTVLTRKIRAVVAYSAPLEMKTSSYVLAKPSNVLYRQLFIRQLMPKVKAKISLFPDEINHSDLEKLKTWEDYMRLFFIQLNGYASLDDFFEKGSALNFISKIQIPTLIVQAQNDPMLTAECFPRDLVKNLPKVWLETPQFGGHCGFAEPNDRRFTYAEKRALTFFESVLGE